MARVALIVVVACATAAAPALADVVYLKDGTQVEGDVKRSADGWVVTGPTTRTVVPAERVKSISVTPATARAGAAADAGLASLRRAADAMTDPRQAVDRYKQFIDRTKDPKTLDEARVDLKAWQDRLDRGLVKVGDEWMTQGRRDEIVAASGELLQGAREMLLAGRAKPAGETIDEVLALDPQNAAAHYLKGVMQLAGDQLAPARKSFEASLAAGKAEHAPTLNNLAVIAVRTKQLPAAVALYDRALAAQPKVRPILDNVAELLGGTLTDEQRDAPAAKRLAERFQEQDVALAAELGKSGLYRWGATWVNGADLEKLKAAEQRVADEVAALQRQFTQVQDAVRQIEGEIDANVRAMRRMEADQYVRDRDGRVVAVPLPRV
ncbi:MAG TPA: hypothetical protein VK324_03780, partial [Tepidisphaeraceae bacterium]|nr:hypothetical protein [Tepidisphaeraceae bacterium]